MISRYALARAAAAARQCQRRARGMSRSPARVPARDLKERAPCGTHACSARIRGCPSGRAAGATAARSPPAAVSQKGGPEPGYALARDAASRRPHCGERKSSSACRLSARRGGRCPCARLGETPRAAPRDLVSACGGRHMPRGARSARRCVRRLDAECGWPRARRARICRARGEALRAAPQRWRGGRGHSRGEGELRRESRLGPGGAKG